MSCDGNRARYFATAAAEAAVMEAFGGDQERAQTIIETIYDTASQRQDVQPALADALTRVLFNQMKSMGMTPPAHAANGLPKPTARQGYAALAQTFMAIRSGRALPVLAAQIAQATPGRPAAPDEEPAELEAYGSRSRRGSGGGSKRSGPDSVCVTIDGRTYYVSGADFSRMKEAIRRYANTAGDWRRFGFDPAAKMWKLPGTLADAQAALGPYRITIDKPETAPSAAVPTEEPAGGAIAPKPTRAARRTFSDDDAGMGPDDDSDLDGGGRYRMPPNAPPGDIPPELMEILLQELRDAPAMMLPVMINLANGQPLSRSDALTVSDFLRGVVPKLRKEFGRKRTDLPLMYWARQFAASSAKRHAMAVAVLTAIGQERCPSCGQFMPTKGTGTTHTCPSRTFGADAYNGFGVDRYGVTRYGTKADGTPVPRRKTVLDAAKDFIVESDPINNPAMADLWGRIASAVAGHDCRVVLREGGGFATDMEGTIYADPYPLGKDADPRHNMVVTKAGIYHEIGHELTTPPEDWAYLLEVAKGEQAIPGIDKSRTFITKMYNIIEDGRMERDMSNRFAGVAETLAAQCTIYPRWHERVGPGVPLADEVVWPLLYTALPYFSMRDDVRDAMTPAGRALFEELEPIALRGALGTTEDSLAATIEITRRLEAAGIFDIPETSATPPPKPPPGTKARSAPPSSSGESGERGESNESGASGRSSKEKAQGEEKGEEKSSGSGAGDGKGQGEEEGNAAADGAEGGDDQAGKSDSQSGGSSTSKTSGEIDPNAAEKSGGEASGSATLPRGSSTVADTRVGERITDEQLEDILNDLEGQAVRAVEREISRQGRYDTLGGLLHAPLTGKTSVLWDEGYAKAAPPADTTRQRYRTPSGEVVSVQTGTSMEENPRKLADLERRRPAQQEISGRLARRLVSIRQEAMSRLRMLPEGRLDRRRFPAALAGREDVRTRTSVTSDTGMAVSVLLDQSGSMRSQHISTNKLYDATCIIGQALEQIDIPYEVRGHGGASTQYKAMEDPALDARRAARLTEDCTNSNFVTAPVVGLATAALLARPDTNKLIVNLMDGDMEDHPQAVAQYQETRKQGIVTFGVFLGMPSADQQRKMTELFGTNNWRPIAALTELPNVVGQRIADIFESLGEE